MEFTNCCQVSSFVFIINIVIGIYYKYYLYSLLFIILLITSLIHHSNYTDFTYVLDKTLRFPAWSCATPNGIVALTIPSETGITEKV